jgi:hypothetical protein
VALGVIEIVFLAAILTSKVPAKSPNFLILSRFLTPPRLNNPQRVECSLIVIWSGRSDLTDLETVQYRCYGTAITRTLNVLASDGAESAA